MGQCHLKRPLIEIDLQRHPSDRELRSTILHEMCHAVAGQNSKGHDSLFFVQLEHLLRERAPITVGFPENPEGGSIASVPTRFVRCRRLLKPLYERQQRAFERRMGTRLSKSRKITGEDIAGRFYLAAFENNVKWQDALQVIGREYSFLDIDGRPMPFAEERVPELRKAHRRGRADARVEEAERRLFRLTQEEWASINGLSYDEAARRLEVPATVLRTYVRTLNQRKEVDIPPVSKSVCD